MSKAFFAHNHYAVINATIKELTNPQERIYLFDTDGIPFTFDVNENYITRDGAVRCTGVAGSSLHRFEPVEDFPNSSQAAFTSKWFEEYKDKTVPGIFISSADIGHRADGIYAIAPMHREAVEQALAAWPLLYVRKNNSHNLTLVEPGDYILFSPDQWIRLPAVPEFDQAKASDFWKFAKL